MKLNRAFTVALLAISATWGCANAQKIESAEGSKYVLTAGDVTMTVSAAEGGKVMSYKYGDKEMLSQLRMQNQYGSTFWTSPQKEWNWPPVAEFDRLAYEVVSQDNSKLVLKSQVSQKLPFSITKTYVPSSKSIKITYSIKNEGTAARKVAPWAISRVISDENGMIFFDAPVEQIEAAQGELIPFKGFAGASWYNFEGTRANRKINSDGKGWLAYTADGLLMVQKFADITPDQPAPSEAEIQVYVNSGKTYIELEAQGAYEELQPGQSLEWAVTWYMTPLKTAAEPSKKLLKTVRKLIR